MRSIIVTDYGVTVAGYGGEPCLRLSWDLPLTMVIEVCKDSQTTESITLADLKAFLAQREVDAVNVGRFACLGAREQVR